MSGRDLSGPLRDAVVAALAVDPSVAALVDNRIYDTVPASPIYPYLRCVITTAAPWEATDALQGATSTVQVDAVSKDGGRQTVELLAAAVVLALDEEDPALTGGTLLSLQWRQTRYVDDPADPTIAHGVVELEAIAVL